ncbi:MAG TPA: glycosyltransferase family 4 protein [Actinomycetota bacterium]|nr:glycosyltransferase family 4 protein [Actinomycetota bacterium]
MRILALTPALPWPPHTGGTRRIAAILEGLAASHEISLFALHGEGGSAEATADAPLAVVRTVPYPGLPERGRIRFWTQLLTDPLPKAVRQAFDGDTLAAAAAFAREVRPDAIYAEPIEMEPCLRACAEAVPSARTMMGWIDVVSTNIRRQTERDRGLPHRLHARREFARMVRLERRVAQSVDARTCVSSGDRAALEALTGRPFVLAPNGVDTALFAPRGGAINDRQLLFVGPLSFPPNRDAINWFAHEILPHLGGVTLTVAGEPAGFAAPQGVGLAGRVTDVRHMMARAGAVVVPLRSGSGTRLKILEALAMGKAVISTRIGAEGLEVQHDRDLLLADDPRAFADAVRRVLGDATLRARLGANGRALVERRYRWQDTVRAVEAALAGEGARV